MNNKINVIHFSIYKILILVFFGIILSNNIFSQVNIKGKVVYKKDSRPAARVTIGLWKTQLASMTDESGNFSFRLPISKNSNDTLVISSIGYESLFLPIHEALKKHVYELVELSKNLPPVTVKSFSSQDVVGATVELAGYFRSWNNERTGGEIGRIFNLPYDEYKIDKIRFKVNNMCNACVVRLHVRKVVNGIPAEELLRDSIAISINSHNVEDKASEFDLSNYEQVFNQNDIFIGLELISCSHNEVNDCNFCFVGTEPGSYTYKPAAASPWGKIDNFSIYLKMFLRF